jgi:transposase
MYPNYSKAFLDLEDVFVKKVIPADSSLKIFIETRTTEQSCPCCSSSTKRVHDYRTQKIDDIPLSRENSYTHSYLFIIEEPEGWPFMLFLYSARRSL